MTEDHGKFIILINTTLEMSLLIMVKSVKRENKLMQILLKITSI